MDPGAGARKERPKPREPAARLEKAKQRSAQQELKQRQRAEVGTREWGGTRPGPGRTPLAIRPLPIPDLRPEPGDDGAGATAVRLLLQADAGIRGMTARPPPSSPPSFLIPRYLLSNRSFYINKIRAGSLSRGSCLLRVGTAWGRPGQGRRQSSCGAGCQLQPWPHPDIPCRGKGPALLELGFVPGGHSRSHISQLLLPPEPPWGS